MGLKISPEAVQGVARPFFATGEPEPVYISGCCGRVFVGGIPAKKCSTCPKIPTVHEVSNLEEIPGVVALIQESWDRLTIYYGGIRKVRKSRNVALYYDRFFLCY
jgi:hypothetical protein